MKQTGDDNQAEAPAVGIVCRRWGRIPSDVGATVGVLPDYVDALTAAGAAALLVPFQNDALALAAMRRCDGLLLAGGEDVIEGTEFLQLSAVDRPVDPERDRLERLLLRDARERGLPVLGICRGMQLVNLEFGGATSRIEDAVSSPLRHITRWREGEVYLHEASLIPSSTLSQLLGDARSIPINCTHQRCAKVVGRGLRVAARAPDGVVEALEATDGAFCVGVQWHPESRALRNDGSTIALFKAFVAACRARRER